MRTKRLAPIAELDSEVWSFNAAWWAMHTFDAYRTDRQRAHARLRELRTFIFYFTRHDARAVWDGHIQIWPTATTVKRTLNTRIRGSLSDAHSSRVCWACEAKWQNLFLQSGTSGLSTRKLGPRAFVDDMWHCLFAAAGTEWVVAYAPIMKSSSSTQARYYIDIALMRAAFNKFFLKNRCNRTGPSKATVGPRETIFRGPQTFLQGPSGKKFLSFFQNGAFWCIFYF